MKMSSGYTSHHLVQNLFFPVCYLITGRLKYKNYINMFQLPCINQSKNIQDAEKLHSQTLWSDGEPKQRLLFKELYVGDASLLHYGTSDWVWLRLENNHNHWSILKKSSISYQFRANVPSATDLDTQLVMQQQLTCGVKNDRLLARQLLLPQQYGQ